VEGAVGVCRGDERGLVKSLRSVNQELLAEIAVERFEVLLVIGLVAAELYDVGGIVAGKLGINDLEVVGRAPVGLADNFDLGIRCLKQLDDLESSTSALVVAPPTETDLGGTTCVNRESIWAGRGRCDLFLDYLGYGHRLLNDLSLHNDPGRGCSACCEQDHESYQKWEAHVWHHVKGRVRHGAFSRMPK
ncbi:MAG: hypothetical protein ACUVRO_15880, partial [Armatimonadota bacterium]